MNSRSWFFFVTVTLSLLMPVVAQSVSRIYVPERPLGLANVLNGWTGRDIQMSSSTEEAYRNVEGVLWRRYTHANQPPVDCLMQRGVNLQHLHDLYNCLELAGTNPVSAGEIELRNNQKASLYQYEWHHHRYYCAFLLQSNDTSAPFPPTTLQTRLSTGLMMPCRLVQLATPAKNDNQGAVRRLTEFANTISELPI